VIGCLSSWPALGSGGAILGLLFGLLHFAALRRTAELYSAGCRIVPSALTLVRLAGAFVFFGLAVRLGAVSLLSAFLGFLVARTVALRMGRSFA
jgi:N-ATPase, AtpR subunit